MTKIVKSKLKSMRRWDYQIYDNLEYTKRKYPPGQHGKNGYRFATSYCASFRVKQVFKKAFLIQERKLRNICREIKANKKLNFDNALTSSVELTPMRVIYNCGFCSTIFHARQIISHGHILVNEKRINLPRARLKVGDVISLRQRSSDFIKNSFATSGKKNESSIPSYLEFNRDSMTIKILREPTADEIALPFKADFTVLASLY
jgi:small subunit ribosomal protein S4